MKPLTRSTHVAHKNVICSVQCPSIVTPVCCDVDSGAHRKFDVSSVYSDI
jgi:hypothetical protein